MSSTSDSDGGRSLGARSNFFDSQESEDYDLEREPGDDSQPSHGDESDQPIGPHHSEVAGVHWHQWVAGHILRSHGNPTILCPACFHELDEMSELTEPRHHLPTMDVDHDFDTDWLTDSRVVTKHDHRRHRHCPKCGVVSFGGVVADRSEAEFVDVVDAVLDGLDERDPIPDARRQELRQAAIRRKEKGDSDQSNMEDLVRELRFGGGED